ncbi:MAG: hypothetical protein VZR24_19310, partial [Butyrivibrio hungatei]|nr:hypothetical protein [Butyrivibrio hungatei]
LVSFIQSFLLPASSFFKTCLSAKLPFIRVEIFAFGSAGNTQYKVTTLITFTGRGCTLDPQYRDASPLYLNKKLPPLNSAKGDCIPLDPLFQQS